MDEYISYPVERDPEEILELAIEDLQAHYPGWEPAPGHVEFWMMQFFANLASQIEERSSLVTRAVFRAWGPMAGVPPLAALHAQGATTWTAIDAQGYTIPAGAVIGMRVSGDQLIWFEVVADVVIPPGETSTGVGAVAVRALNPGAEANNLSGSAEVVSATYSWLAGVEMEASTFGGQDAESDDVYVSRLSRELELQSPRPILPDDFGVLARRVAGVSRATVLDGYNPDDDSFNNARMVAVAVTDADGEELPGGTHDQVESLLESMREQNFIVNVISPTYTVIDVAVSLTVVPGYDPTGVAAAVELALAAYLSPKEWGMPITGDSSSMGGWDNKTTVRWLEVATVVNNVPGVDYITALAVEGGTSDVVMSGRVCLPRPGTIVATVV